MKTDDRTSPATLVVRHCVKPARRRDYELWLKRTGSACERHEGLQGANVIRPAGPSGAYTIVLRFDCHANLSRWTGSQERRALVEEVRPLLEGEEALEHETGLEYWFTPPSPAPARPRPFKQFLVSLSAIYPLILLVPLALEPLFAAVPPLAHPLLAKLVIAVIVVLLMVYVVMPRTTRWLGAWLFR